eukprot:g20397.t1
MPQRFQLTQKDQPQGVDLALDKFDLSQPERFASNMPPCSAPFDSVEGRITLGKAFLKSLTEGSYDSLGAEHVTLLKQVFNPVLADRISEGTAFVPPDPNLDYVQKLRNLVQENCGTASGDGDEEKRRTIDHPSPGGNRSGKAEEGSLQRQKLHPRNGGQRVPTELDLTVPALPRRPRACGQA